MVWPHTRPGASFIKGSSYSNSRIWAKVWLQRKAMFTFCIGFLLLRVVMYHELKASQPAMMSASDLCISFKLLFRMFIRYDISAQHHKLFPWRLCVWRQRRARTEPISSTNMSCILRTCLLYPSTLSHLHPSCFNNKNTRKSRVKKQIYHR